MVLNFIISYELGRAKFVFLFVHIYIFINKDSNFENVFESMTL